MSTRFKTAEDFDWYKHYPATFATKTAHLGHVELGVYRRLLDHYWTSDNKLPQDSAEIVERIGEKVFNWRRYGIVAPAGFDNEEVTAKVVEYILREFLEQDEDGNWCHLWLDEYRSAADGEFRARSKASKERVARQARGSKGKFAKITTVPDGELSPCLTDKNTVPDGEGTVEKSREEKSTEEQSREEEIKEEETKVEHREVSDGASTLLKNPPVSRVESPLLTPEHKANLARLHAIKQRSEQQAA